MAKTNLTKLNRDDPNCVKWYERVFKAQRFNDLSPMFGLNEGMANREGSFITLTNNPTQAEAVEKLLMQDRQPIPPHLVEPLATEKWRRFSLLGDHEDKKSEQPAATRQETQKPEGPKRSR